MALAVTGRQIGEQGLVKGRGGRERQRLIDQLEQQFQAVNTGKLLIADVPTEDGMAKVCGDCSIDGVPGTGAKIMMDFSGTVGAVSGKLLPTGNPVDTIGGVEVTLIDNGMPCVILSAADFGVRGDESPADLDADTALKARIEAIRLEAGPLMNLGDVTAKSVPKMTLVSPARSGGTVSTRTFIPHACHAAIGVLGAVSVASACLLPEGPAARIANVPPGMRKSLSIEHPTGEFTVIASLDTDGEVASAGVLRTARKLFDGVVFG